MSKNTNTKPLLEWEKKVLKMLAPVRKDWENGLFNPLPKRFRPSK